MTYLHSVLIISFAKAPQVFYTGVKFVIFILVSDIIVRA